jgi:putative effector of murein hydrolase
MENLVKYFKKRNLAQMSIPLLVGFLLYLFFHKPNLLIHSFIAKCTTIPNYYDYFKENKVFIFLLNHLPDALWIYSFGLFLFVSFGFIKKSWLKAALIVLIGSLTEIVQLFYQKNFTFDWIDLFINLIILILICFRYEIKKDI